LRPAFSLELTPGRSPLSLWDPVGLEQVQIHKYSSLCPRSCTPLREGRLDALNHPGKGYALGPKEHPLTRLLHPINTA